MHTHCSHGFAETNFNLQVSPSHHSCYHQCTHQANNQSKRQISTFYDENVYTKIADTLEKQFKQQSSFRENQIFELKEEISKMKVHILRLENRNKLDRQNQKKLQSQLSELKLSQNSRNEQHKSQIRQVIKQVLIKQQDPQKEKQIKRLKQKNKQIQDINAKMISDLERCKNQNSQLIQQLRFERQRAVKFVDTIKEYQGQIQKLKNKLKMGQYSIIQLEQKVNKLQIQSRNVKIEERQKIIYKPQTRVQTIYIQKPIQKLVYVDVPRTVKQFIQPPQPVVNRMIDCKQNCKCDQNQITYTEQQIDQIRYSYQQTIDILQQNIQKYQQQRKTLVQVIKDRDSDLHLLQMKLRMLGNGVTKTNTGYQPSVVTVSVTKQSDQIENQKKSQSQIKGKKAVQSTRGMGSKRA